MDILSSEELFCFFEAWMFVVWSCLYQIEVHILSLLLVPFFFLPYNWPVEIITEPSNLLCQYVVY